MDDVDALVLRLTNTYRGPTPPPPPGLREMLRDEVTWGWDPFVRWLRSHLHVTRRLVGFVLACIGLRLGAEAWWWHPDPSAFDLWLSVVPWSLGLFGVLMLMFGKGDGTGRRKPARHLRYLRYETVWAASWHRIRRGADSWPRPCSCQANPKLPRFQGSSVR